MTVSTIPEPWRPGEEPAACLARFASAADRRATPCGDGDMVWHIFGDGPPLVLLHGGHGAWTHWVRNIPELAKHFRLFVADMPGHGASDMPPEPISGPGIAAVISEGLQQLLPSGERYHAAGFSFGGIIGGCLAARDGARMSTLTICGSNGLGLRRGKLSGFQHWRGLTDANEIAAAHRRNLEIVMFGDPKHVDELAVHMQSVNTPMSRIKSRLIAVTNVLADVLPHVEARLNGIWGKRDGYAKMYMPEREALFRAAQPDCSFRVIDDAGHWVMYEQPDDFNKVLLEKSWRGEGLTIGRCDRIARCAAAE